MVIKEIGKPQGFQVVRESDEWRIAYHAYQKGVNSVGDLGKWGIHPESEEMFVLIQGSMILATAGKIESKRSVELHEVEKGKLYFIEKGEKHAIVLKEDSLVLIAENRDMNNYIEREMDNRERKEILEFFTRN